MIKSQDARAAVETMLGRTLSEGELSRVDNAAKNGGHDVLAAFGLTAADLITALVEMQEKAAAMAYLAGNPDDEKVAETVSRIRELRA